MCRSVVCHDRQSSVATPGLALLSGERCYQFVPRTPDKAVTPLVPPGLSRPAPHVSAAALHIDIYPRLPGMMAEHPRSAEAGATASWGPTAALSP